MSGGKASIEASMVFEKLFADLIASQGKDVRAVIMRKLRAMSSENPSLGCLTVDDEGNVSISILEQHTADSTAALSGAFDTSVDIAGFFVGEEVAFKAAMEIVSRVEKQFGGPFARLRIRDSILRGAMARQVPTGIDGLDDVLGGGLPTGEAVLLFGPPGTAKQHFGLHFLSQGLKTGGAGLVVLSSMSVKEMRSWLAVHGVSHSAVESRGRLKIVDWYSQKSRAIVGLEESASVYVPSKDIANLDIALRRAIDSIAFSPTRRAYLDMITFALTAYDVSDVFEFVQRFKTRLKEEGFTSMFVVEAGAHDERVEAMLRHMADTVMAITDDGMGSLFLEVLSMSSGKPKVGKVSVVISSRGISVRETALDEAKIISELCRIPGVTKEIAQNLVDAGFNDIEMLNSAEMHELRSVSGITEDAARGILEYTKTVEFTRSLLASRSRKWLSKARDQAASGDIRKARKSLERALEIDPSNAEAKEFLSEIESMDGGKR